MTEIKNNVPSSSNTDVNSIQFFPDWYAWDKKGMISQKPGVPIEDVFILREDAIDAVKAQIEYINLLQDELGEVVSMMAVHGWRSTRYEKGKELRDKIRSLLNQEQNDELCDASKEDSKVNPD